MAVFLRAAHQTDVSRKSSVQVDNHHEIDKSPSLHKKILQLSYLYLCLYGKASERTQGPPAREQPCAAHQRAQQPGPPATPGTEQLDTGPH